MALCSDRIEDGNSKFILNVAGVERGGRLE
jgi:hypothetical protein